MRKSNHDHDADEAITPVDRWTYFVLRLKDLIWMQSVEPTGTW